MNRIKQKTCQRIKSGFPGQITQGNRSRFKRVPFLRRMAGNATDGLIKVAPLLDQLRRPRANRVSDRPALRHQKMHQKIHGPRLGRRG